LQNFGFTFKNLWKWDKSAILITFLRIPINVSLPLLGTYMSKYVVDVVTTNGSVGRLLSYILIFSLAMLALQIIGNVTNTKLQYKTWNHRVKYTALVHEKQIDADYDIVESPDNQTKFEKAFSAAQGRNWEEEMITVFIRVVTNLTGFVTCGAIIFTLNPLIVLLLALTTVGNYFAYQAMHKWIYKNKDNWTPIDRKINYIHMSSGDFSSAKDIRLYNLSAWFKDLFKSILKERLGWQTKYNVIRYSADMAWLILTLIRDGIAYGYLIYRMLTVGMPISDFVLYFGLIARFSNWWLDFIWSLIVMSSTSLAMCDLRECLDMPDNSNRGKGIDLPPETCEIEFKNVSFKYPKSESYTIENMSFKIAAGEKIAIVGPNGAGKTTLIKLMCGLYRPTEGEILVNGKNKTQYNRDEYYTLFSAVFQDIHLIPVSIAQNIALQDDAAIDKGKIGAVLNLSGLYEKVNSLPKGQETLLLKSFCEDATELSGGETQKLALARALYKNGKIIVLDEPTAALDPIAESEMYQKYDELTSGRTAVYISHRLSSTRFCDRIFFLENGEIKETGNHVELMEKGGEYANMFDIQSHYYKENNNENALCEEAEENA